MVNTASDHPEFNNKIQQEAHSIPHHMAPKSVKMSTCPTTEGAWVCTSPNKKYTTEQRIQCSRLTSRTDYISL